MKLIAKKTIPETRARKLTYSTRMLVAGDPFEARSDIAGRVLLATRYARLARQMSSAEAALPVSDDPLPALREEYQRVVGKKPFMGWDADTLRAKIAEAGNA